MILYSGLSAYVRAYLQNTGVWPLSGFIAILIGGILLAFSILSLVMIAIQQKRKKSEKIKVWIVVFVVIVPWLTYFLDGLVMPIR
jgi:hypothetical protein